MIRLYLLRHAKSDWGNMRLVDRDRPLNSRGKKAANQLGRYMKEQALAPDLILCSPAKRTRSTLKRVKKQAEADWPVTIDDRLYGADAMTVLELIMAQSGTVQSLMLVGHNPTFHNVASVLTGRGDRSVIEKMREKYPTGALAIIDFDVDSFADIAMGRGKLVAFVRPRDLEAS